MNDRESTYRLRAFQLARLRYALARRRPGDGDEFGNLVDAAIVSLYNSCDEVGAGEQARDLITQYRRRAATNRG